MKTYKYPIVKLEPNQIFVFGSNTQGRHGKGAALWAKQNAGAIYGQARGRQGQSYAIITKDLTKTQHPSISSLCIAREIERLYVYATINKELEFLVAYRAEGVNLNGYSAWEMARLFSTGYKLFGTFTEIPANIVFEEEFYKLVKQAELN